MKGGKKGGDLIPIRKLRTMIYDFYVAKAKVGVA
jgi:hypothetical protein